MSKITGNFYIFLVKNNLEIIIWKHIFSICRKINIFREFSLFRNRSFCMYMVRIKRKRDRTLRIQNRLCPTPLADALHFSVLSLNRDKMFFLNLWFLIHFRNNQRKDTIFIFCFNILFCYIFSYIEASAA